MPAADSSISLDALRLDPERATEEIVEGLRKSVLVDMRRRGAVVGLSGGVDSSVCVALCARAFEPERVVALLMPEAESASDTLELSRLVADHFGVETVLEDISGLLDAAGCYRRRDDAIRRVLPEYGPGWRAKIVLPSLLDGDRLRVFSLVAESPEGESRQVRLTADAYREVVAATSFKQRTRKMLEYYHADRVTYAVVGTPNRLEYDQGFFVKNGDGAADVKPIAHLYKTQVYQLAEYLDVPEAGPVAAADDGHVFPPAEPGGVLLLRFLRDDGSLSLCVEPRPFAGLGLRCRRVVDRGGRARLPRHRDKAARDGLPTAATPARPGCAGDRPPLT